MGALVWLGDAARDAILGAASGLKSEWVPGLVALGLVALLLAALGHLAWRTGPARCAPCLPGSRRCGARRGCWPA